MSIARAAGLTGAEILAMVREEAEDPSTDVDGNAITPKFSDTVAYTAVNHTLKDMQNEMSGLDSAEGLRSADVSFAASSAPTDLGTTINAQGVFRVAVVDGSTLTDLQQASVLEEERWQADSWAQWTRRSYRIEATATGYGISVRPVPSATLTLRIWYVAAPLVMSGTPGSEIQLLSAQWSELIAVATAVRLLSRSWEVTDALKERNNSLWDQFRRYASRAKGPRRIRQSRRAIA